MRVSVGHPGGPLEELASIRIDDSRDGGERWTPLEADLSAFAGKRITLRLELVPDDPIADPSTLLAWWGSPRIALPPEAAAPGAGGPAASPTPDGALGFGSKARE